MPAERKDMEFVRQEGRFILVKTGKAEATWFKRPEGIKIGD